MRPIILKIELSIIAHMESGEGTDLKVNQAAGD